MQATTFSQVYDYETAIESALEDLFLLEGFAAESVWTPASDPELQKNRPRIEIYCASGQEDGHVYRNADGTSIRPDTFSGNVALRIVSNSLAESATTQEHAAFRASARNVMAKARLLLVANAAAEDDILPFHSILDVVEAGTSASYQSEDGYYESTISYNIKINIRPSAWPSE
jgi:hypothetical protein